jgi:hypothetical protein
MSESQLNCGNCGYSWMTRGKEYSLRCPQCGAILPDRSGGRGISSYVLIIVVFVIAPVGAYFAWPHFFPQRPLPAPPVAPSVEVVPAEAPPQAPPAPPKPKPVEKPEVKPVPEVTPERQPSPADVAAKDNKTATRKLSLVKPFLKRGETETARRRLKEIIELHSETEAAEEARRMLEKLE